MTKGCLHDRPVANADPVSRRARGPKKHGSPRSEKTYCGTFCSIGRGRDPTTLDCERRLDAYSVSCLVFACQKVCVKGSRVKISLRVCKACASCHVAFVTVCVSHWLTRLRCVINTQIRVCIVNFRVVQHVCRRVTHRRRRDLFTNAKRTPLGTVIGARAYHEPRMH